MDKNRRRAIRCAAVLGMLWWLFGGFFWLGLIFALRKFGLSHPENTIGAVFVILVVLLTLFLCWRLLLLRRWAAILLCLMTWTATLKRVMNHPVNLVIWATT